MTRSFIILLLLTLACIPVIAQEPEFRIRVDVDALAPKGERWIELRSRNFLVVGNDSEDRIRKVAADLELFRVQFELFFPRARRTSSVPTTVVVFRNGTTFEPYRRVVSGKPEDVEGYFQAGTDKNYLVLSDKKPNRAIYREYVRTLIPDSMGPVPAWFRAGLSEYFTTYQVTWRGDSRWIEVGGRDKQFNGLLRDDSVIPLRSFLENERPFGLGEGEINTTAYAQAWALTHYFLQHNYFARLEDRQGWGRFVNPALDFFQALTEGVSVDEGFETAFFQTVEDFEGDSRDGSFRGFRGYLKLARVGVLRESERIGGIALRTERGWPVNLAGFSLNPERTDIRVFFYREDNCTAVVRGIAGLHAVVPVPCGASLVTIPVNYDETWAEIQGRSVRLLSEAETDFYRGDLMLHIGRRDEAEELLQLAIRIDPALSDAHAALGLLRSRQGQQDAALNSLKQAIALSDDNYLAHYYFALAAEGASSNGSRPTPQDLVTIAAELRKTIQLAPHFVEATVKLAEINAERQEDLDETIDLIREAAKPSPGREDLTLTTARVLIANQNKQEADRVLARTASSRTAESVMKEAAELLRDSVAQTPDAPTATQEFFANTDEPVQKSVEFRTGADDDIPEGSGSGGSIKTARRRDHQRQTHDAGLHLGPDSRPRHRGQNRPPAYGHSG